MNTTWSIRNETSRAKLNYSKYRKQMWTLKQQRNFCKNEFCLGARSKHVALGFTVQSSPFSYSRSSCRRRPPSFRPSRCRLASRYPFLPPRFFVAFETSQFFQSQLLHEFSEIFKFVAGQGVCCLTLNVRNRRFSCALKVIECLCLTVSDSSRSSSLFSSGTDPTPGRKRPDAIMLNARRRQSPIYGTWIWNYPSEL